MQNRFVRLLIGCCLLCAGCSSGSISADLEKLKRVEDEKSRREAAKSLADQGRDAVPALIDALGHDDDQVRQAAVVALGEIGPDAVSAVPAIIEVSDTLENVAVFEYAKLALNRIGADAVPQLVEALSDERLHVRIFVIDALDYLGPEAEPALPKLINFLEDDSVRIRRLAAKAIGKIDADRDKSVPALIQAFADEDRQVRSYAVASVVKMQPESIPLLIDALESDDGNTRSCAAKSLAGMGDKASAAVPDLVKALNDDQKSVRHDAVIALGRIGPEANVAVPAIFDAMRKADAHTKYTTALKSIGLDPKVAVPEYIKVLDNKNALISLAASSALTDFGADAVQDLIAAIEAENPAKRELAIRIIKILGQIGPDAKAAAPTLFEFLEDEELKFYAGSALKRIGVDEEILKKRLGRVPN